MLTSAIIKQLPKVELHDHLDGGVRVETIIELASEYGIALPSTDPKSLHEWFARGGKQKSLTLYLRAFGVTTSVMQTKEALKRIAFEAVEDLAEDRVCYAEIRFAPNLHTAKGLTMEESVQAVLDGLDQGTRKTGVPIGLILCAMRNQSPAVSLEVAGRESPAGGMNDLSGLRLKPVPVGPGLLAYLDRATRARLIRRWNAAVSGVAKAGN